MFNQKLKRMGMLCLTFGMVLTAGVFGKSAGVSAAGYSKDDAEEVTFGEKIEDAISEKAEEDWYCFTTSTSDSGANSWYSFTMMYKNKAGSGGAPTLYLYDEDEEEIGELVIYSSNSNKTKYYNLEQDKTYYMKIASEYKNDTADYIFTVEELQDEAGDALETANTLEKNTTNRFEMQAPGDEDWFYVESDTLHPVLTIKSTNVPSVDIRIYDIDGIELDSFAVYAKGSQSKSLSLTENCFYIRVYTYFNGDEDLGNYTISLSDKVNVTKVTLNKSKVTLKKGKSVTLKAKVTPSSASNKKVTWKSSNSRIATVSSTGKVTAKRAGKVTITCTTKDGSKKKATCKITVK
ncbi:Ig-like domain-containing protein [Anaeromicropila populeti]|uniref:Ig-like domain (Group 2) n=1 Tax=Anaeromicropila populeti TaxID=37658 RepID=A0A1I6JRB3_9FIRM|nr:Ig-like domain-containing protein [Anaeromicropila populeti]SFR81514.1 Ig-like domain (group 2) [Anaeromicropila populeti]